MTIHLWDPATGHKLRDIEHVSDAPNVETFAGGGVPSELACSMDGRWLAASSKDGRLQVWDTSTGKLARQFPGPGMVASQLAFSPDGKLLATVKGSDGAVRLWDVAKGTEVHAMSGHRSGPLAVAFEGQTVLTAGRSRGNWSTTEPSLPKSDSSLRRWDAATGSERSVFPIPLRGWGLYTTFSSDGKQFACTDEDGNLLVFDTITGKQVSQWTLPKREVEVRSGDKVDMRSFMDFKDLRFSPDNRLLMATGGQVILYDVATGVQRQRLPSNRAALPVLYASIMGLLASPLKQGPFLVASALTPGIPDTANYSRGVFTPDQTGLVLLASTHGRTPCLLRDALSGREIRKVGEGGDFSRPIPLSPDGRTVLSGGAFTEGPIRLWELSSGLERGKLANSPRRPSASAFAPNGRLLALGESDGMIGLWDLTSCKRIGQAAGHRAAVCSLAFSADGRLLASSGDENFALVWNVADVTRATEQGALKLRPGQLGDLWTDLASEDGTKAYQAIWQLALTPDLSVPFLRERVKPSNLDSQRLAKLVAELDDELFSVREQATAELAGLDEEAETVLRAALQKKPSAEQQRRVKQILSKLGTRPSPERLRLLRAVEVLEHCGTREAKELLRALSKGASEARLTQEARASLNRLGDK
jgi:WD40 repeat protein